MKNTSSEEKFVNLLVNGSEKSFKQDFFIKIERGTSKNKGDTRPIEFWDFYSKVAI